MPSQEEGGLQPTQVEGEAEGEQEPKQAGLASLNQ